MPESNQHTGQAPREDGSVQGGAGGAQQKAGEVQRRRRRRWPLVLVLLAVLGCGLVAMAPALASTAPVRGWLLSYASGKLQGTIAAEGMSLTWADRCELRGVSVRDAKDREVLTTDSLIFDGGLWSARRALTQFKRISIAKPSVRIYIGEDGAISLAHAFSSAQGTAGTGTAPGATSVPDGDVELIDGSLRVYQPDGRELSISDIDATIHIAAAGALRGKLRVEFEQGGAVSTDVEVDGFLKDGVIDFDSAVAALNARSETPIKVRSFAEFALNDKQAGGEIDLSVEAQYGKGQVSGDIRTELVEVSAPGATDRAVTPISAALGMSVRGSLDQMHADIEMEGGMGSASATIDCPLSELGSITVAGIEQALLEGTPSGIPAMDVKASGQIDLPALAKAMPGILQVRPGTEITSGRVTLADFSLVGGDAAEVKATISVEDLAALADGETIDADPIQANIAAHLEPGVGLKLSNAEVKTGFGFLRAEGSAEQINATVEGNLSALQSQLGKVFDFGDMALAGNLLAQLDIERAGADEHRFRSQVVMEGLRYQSNNGAVAVQLAKFGGNGVLTLHDADPKRVEMRESELDLDGQLRVMGSGWYDFASGGFQADADVQQADLAYVGRQAGGAGVEALKEWSGRIQGTATIERSSADGPMVTEGNIQARALKMGERAVADSLTCDWTRTSYLASSQSVDIEKLQVGGDMINLTAEKARAQLGDRLSMDGRVKLHADLEHCLTLAGAFADGDLPNLTGTLDLETQFKSDGDGFTAAGDGTLKNVVITSGDTQVREDIALAFDATVLPGSEKIELRKFDWNGRLASLGVAGSVSDYGTLTQLDLDGNYEMSWQEVMDLVHELAPSTAETLRINGSSAGKIVAKGPARQPSAKPEFAGLTASTELSWDSANVYGVELSKTVIAPKLAKGMLTVPETSFSAGGGTVRLAGELDFSTPDPTLRTPEKLALLDGIKITPLLSKDLLGSFNPIFRQATRVDGIINMMVQAVELPLGDAGGNGGGGSGVIQLKNAKVQPGGILAELIRLADMGTGEMYAVRFSGLNFHIEDRRIHYRDFQMTFGENVFDLVFYGSVGMDSTLDLVVSVPVRPGLLRQLGVSGPIEQYAEKLKDKRVDIPVVGTKDSPQLDLARVNVQKLLGDVVTETLLGDDAKDLTDPNKLLDNAGKLIGGEKDKKDADQKKDDKKDAGLGGLLDGLSGNKKDRKKN